MATRIIVLLNLKPGVSVADYETFAREQDIPACNSLESIDQFEIYQSTGLFRSDAPAPYQYVEIIDIADMELFGKEAATERMQAVAAKFRGMADPIFIVTEKLG